LSSGRDRGPARWNYQTAKPGSLGALPYFAANRMSELSRVLPYRLEREPSLATELRQAVVYASVPLLLVALAGYGWTTNRPATPLFEQPLWIPLAGAVLALMTLGFLGNVAVKALRALRGTAPLVEMETAPLRPAQQTRARVSTNETSGLAKLEVYLIAEAIRAERVPLTSMSAGGWRFTELVVHQQQLASADGATLAAPFDRTVALTLPAAAADRAWRWQILVVGTTPRGLPREDRYPLPVETGAAPSSILEVEQ
jgi:hypothetical protein